MVIPFKKHLQRLLLYFSGAICLSAPWYFQYTTLFVFVGFFVLLVVAKKAREKGSVFSSFLIFFLLWNIFTTWWVTYSTFLGAVGAIFANSFIMTLVILVASFISKKLNKKFHFILIPVWITYEYFHHNWDLTWPWLTLGNAFSKSPIFVQWYEFTGSSGGSLWILLVSALLFDALSEKSSPQFKKKTFGTIFSFVLPVLFSLFLNFSPEETPIQTKKVLILQPNVDPYKDKFRKRKIDIFNALLKLGISKIDSSYHLVVGPETAITHKLLEKRIHNNFLSNRVQKELLRYPNQEALIGCTTEVIHEDTLSLPEYARYWEKGAFWYSYYNSALFYNSDFDSVSIYHKSKLTPLVERIPFLSVLQSAKKLEINMGGTRGSLGYQDEAEVFTSQDSSYSVAPIICYESLFSDYVREFILKGASFIAIITNDGWWDNSPGYVQHFDLSRLRAIETRRYIVRSANTGISGIIDTKGNVVSKTGWWVPTVLTGEVPIFHNTTFFVLFGNYISRTCIFIFVLLLLLSVTKRMRK